MSATLSTCECPGCGNDWQAIGTVTIVGTVPQQHDLLGQAKIGIDLVCSECETQYEVWLPLESFVRSEEVCHGN